MMRMAILCCALFVGGCHNPQTTSELIKSGEFGVSSPDQQRLLEIDRAMDEAQLAPATRVAYFLEADEIIRRSDVSESCQERCARIRDSCVDRCGDDTSCINTCWTRYIACLAGCSD